MNSLPSSSSSSSGAGLAASAELRLETAVSLSGRTLSAADLLAAMQSLTRNGNLVSSVRLETFLDCTEDEDDADALCDALCRFVRKRSSQLVEFKLVQHLRRRRWTIERARRLADAFECCDALETVALDDLLLAPRSVAALLAMLCERAPNVTALSVSGNECNREATPVLVQAVRSLPLDSLHCARCNFSIASLEDVVMAVSGCLTLRTVSFANVFDASRDRRALLLRHELLETATHLRSVSLSNLHLDSHFFSEIARGVQKSKLTAFRLIDRPLQQITAADTDIWLELVDMIRQCTSLRSLELSAHLPVVAVEEFAAALDDNTRLTQLIVTDHGDAASQRIRRLTDRNSKLLPHVLSAELVSFGLLMAPLDLPTLVLVNIFEWTDVAYASAPLHRKWSVLQSTKRVWQNKFQNLKK
jgi:hypothetical protein